MSAAILSTDEYYASLPTRRSNVGVLIFDDRGDILMLRPTYRSGWILPGGTIEAGEGPRAAGARECLEELGVEIEVGPLRCVQSNPQRGDVTESYCFVFGGPTLDPATQGGFELRAGELVEWEFVPIDAALDRAPEMLRPRLEAAWHAHHTDTVAYLE